MTDPRIAALAEALHHATCGPVNDHWTDGRDEPSDIETHRAAAILGALPFGWCGHIGVEEAVAAGVDLVEDEVAGGGAVDGLVAAPGIGRALEDFGVGLVRLE